LSKGCFRDANGRSSYSAKASFHQPEKRDGGACFRRLDALYGNSPKAFRQINWLDGTFLIAWLTRSLAGVLLIFFLET
jgi:hypothetical protein